MECPKPQKGKFSQLIVDEIKNRSPPGRFLKQDPDTKLWYDIGEKKALDKTRQALREGAPDIQKELKGEGEPANSPTKQTRNAEGLSETSPVIYQQNVRISCLCLWKGRNRLAGV